MLSRYDPEQKVVDEIIKVDLLLRKIIFIMRSRPDIFHPFWTRQFEKWRENIGAHGGMLWKRIQWRKEE